MGAYWERIMQRAYPGGPIFFSQEQYSGMFTGAPTGKLYAKLPPYDPNLLDSLLAPPPSSILSPKTTIPKDPVIHLLNTLFKNEILSTLIQEQAKAYASKTTRSTLSPSHFITFLILLTVFILENEEKILPTPYTVGELRKVLDSADPSINWSHIFDTCLQELSFTVSKESLKNDIKKHLEQNKDPLSAALLEKFDKIFSIDSALPDYSCEITTGIAHFVEFKSPFQRVMLQPPYSASPTPAKKEDPIIKSAWFARLVNGLSCSPSLEKKLEQAKNKMSARFKPASPSLLHAVIPCDDQKTCIIMIGRYVSNPTQDRCLLYLLSNVTAEDAYHPSEYKETVQLGESIYSFFRNHPLAARWNGITDVRVSIETQAKCDPTGARVEQQQKVHSWGGGKLKPDPSQDGALEITYHVFHSGTVLEFEDSAIKVALDPPMSTNNLDGLLPLSSTGVDSSQELGDDYCSCSLKEEGVHFLSGIKTPDPLTLAHIEIAPLPSDVKEQTSVLNHEIRLFSQELAPPITRPLERPKRRI